MFEISGDFLRVQLMNRARRSEKSHRLCWHSSSCMALRVIGFSRLSVLMRLRPCCRVDQEPISVMLGPSTHPSMYADPWNVLALSTGL